MGEVFAGRYELVDPIGRGGAGAVWRAWDHRRRRYVAAKVLQQSDAHALLRFVREQALRIDHPHVLAPASWAADDDKVLFTMDLVAGGSLVHLVGDYGPLPPAFVCTLLDQLLSGLAAVHAEGVVHRDVKPANVLLEATGTGRPRLRLSDFGVAMRLGEPRLTETDYVVGTPGYLAPEQLMGADPDFTADLFAVGLVALYLLQGARPDSRALVQHFTAHGTPGAPRGVPGPLWEVVATLLQPDPAARFRTATGARKALAAARELLPEPGSDDERTEIFEVEIFDQIGPLPQGFGPEGPLITPSGVTDPAAVGPHGTDTTGVGPEETLSGAAGGVPKPPPPVVPGAGEARPFGPGAIPPRPVTAPVSPGAGASAMAPGPPFPAVGPGSTPPALPPRPSVDPTPPPRPPALSDTGSFHLPPPLPRETVPRPPGQPPAPPAAAVATGPMPARAAPHEPTWQPRHTPSAGPHTAPALAVRGPAPAHTATPSSQAPTRPGGPARHGRRPGARRPGPPAKIALPVLLLALLCFAVGFWALARV
ncbi:serine/threonine-protein kinase [Streptomyces sp. SID2888]|uniref:serine/threonine-protein kinase n=1 Tax=Streptomyces sp. SID2888 TaxID=2690256 RepID=UPI00136D26BB|nr:serine/threonine-protein kinase [Streptomyces sp. SID2888]MYV48597.1 protein kinase [Streptomyces sp. SID2888]